jgi:hypothetical protein
MEGRGPQPGAGCQRAGGHPYRAEGGKSPLHRNIIVNHRGFLRFHPLQKPLQGRYRAVTCRNICRHSRHEVAMVTADMVVGKSNPPHPGPLPRGEGEPSAAGRRIRRARKVRESDGRAPVLSRMGDSGTDDKGIDKGGDKGPPAQLNAQAWHHRVERCWRAVFRLCVWADSSHNRLMNLQRR